MKVFVFMMLLITLVFASAVNLSAQEGEFAVTETQLFLYAGAFWGNGYADSAITPFAGGGGPDYRFSVGRCVGAGLMNPLFGLGAFTMGDSKGGLVIMLLDALGYGGLLLGALIFPFEDENSMAMGFVEIIFFPITLLVAPQRPDLAADAGRIIFGGLLMSMGAYALAIVLPYWFIQPFAYRLQPRNRTARLDDARNWDIGLATDENGKLGGRIAFTAHF